MHTACCGVLASAVAIDNRRMIYNRLSEREFPNIVVASGSVNTFLVYKKKHPAGRKLPRYATISKNGKSMRGLIVKHPNVLGRIPLDDTATMAFTLYNQFRIETFGAAFVLTLTDEQAAAHTELKKKEAKQARAKKELQRQAVADAAAEETRRAGGTEAIRARAEERAEELQLPAPGGRPRPTPTPSDPQPPAAPAAAPTAEPAAASGSMVVRQGSCWAKVQGQRMEFPSPQAAEQFKKDLARFQQLDSSLDPELNTQARTLVMQYAQFVFEQKIEAEFEMFKLKIG
jgi:hypothetical protein